MIHVGRLLEAVKTSNSEELTEKALDLAIKLIDRRFNCLVLAEEGE
jgi:hypothetical protein